MSMHIHKNYMHKVFFPCTVNDNLSILIKKLCHVLIDRNYLNGFLIIQTLNNFNLFVNPKP